MVFLFLVISCLKCWIAPRAALHQGISVFLSFHICCCELIISQSWELIDFEECMLAMIAYFDSSPRHCRKLIDFANFLFSVTILHETLTKKRECKVLLHKAETATNISLRHNHGFTESVILQYSIPPNTVQRPSFIIIFPLESRHYKRVMTWACETKQKNPWAI